MRKGQLSGKQVIRGQGYFCTTLGILQHLISGFQRLDFLTYYCSGSIQQPRKKQTGGRGREIGQEEKKERKREEKQGGERETSGREGKEGEISPVA